MILEINFINKQISVKSECKISELLEKLQELHIDPKEWTIKQIEYSYIPNYPYWYTTPTTIIPPFYTTCTTGSIGTITYKEYPHTLTDATITIK